MMSQGKLYGVSVGPGDPELITLKAVRILQEADVIASPNVGKGRQLALGIVQDHIRGKQVIDCSTPMTRDREASARAYDAIADTLAQLLDQGKTVAFVALGDAGVYSTYYYIHERLEARGYACEVVPGVTSFSAAAARLGMPLCEGAEQLLVVPVLTGDAREALDVPGTKVFMKSGRDLQALQQLLRSRGVADQARMVAECGLEGEYLAQNLDAADCSGSRMAVVVLPARAGAEQE